MGRAPSRRAVAIEGPARLKLQLTYPFSGVDPLRVTGDYNFAGATATVGKSLAMRDVKGHLIFTERGVNAPQLTGTLFDKPAVLSLVTQPDGQVVTQVDGRIETDAMGPWVPAPMLAKLTGGFDWKARPRFRQAGARARRDVGHEGPRVVIAGAAHEGCG